MTKKRCSTCKTTFLATPEFFYRNRSSTDGLGNQCCTCGREAARGSRSPTRKFVPRSTSEPDRDGMRLCYHCTDWLPLDGDHFKPTTNTRAGFSRQCWKCIQARRRQARRENWANRLRGYAIGRHKRYTDPCDLTVEHIEMLWERQQGLCAWFKVPMVQDMDEGDRLRLVTLDRVDSSKGYTKNNTALVCKAANQCRGNAPMETFEIFLREVIGS